TLLQAARPPAPTLLKPTRAYRPGPGHTHAQEPTRTRSPQSLASIGQPGGGCLIAVPAAGPPPPPLPRPPAAPPAWPPPPPRAQPRAAGGGGCCVGVSGGGGCGATGRAGGGGRPPRNPAPAEPIGGRQQANPAAAIKEIPMRAAFHTYLTYAWTVDWYPQAQPD